MRHEIHSVISFQATAPYTLRLVFEDGSIQVIDFLPILAGELFGPLRELKLFNQVKLDPEARTVVWPNGADFDPALLHDWPKHVAEFSARVKQWDHQDSRKVAEPTPAYGRIKTESGRD
jgi:hypothetical protein